MRLPLTILAVALAAAIALPLSGGPAPAQPADPRNAVQQGQALPLRSILQQVLPRFPGQLLKADLTRESNGQMIYRLRILDESGKVILVTTDARSGRILSARGSDR
jgi:uncharacterized membrane protein YkoI